MNDYTLIFPRIPKTGSTTLKQIVIAQYGKSKLHGNPMRLNQVPLKKRKRIRIVYGHAYYGLHELLHAPSVYVVMLREPIDRVVSHYYFVKGYKHHSLHILANSMSFDEYLARPEAEHDICNIQTKMLSGYYNSISATGVYITGIYSDTIGTFSQDDLLRAAKSNLRTCIVGLTEYFAESVETYARILNWEGPFATHRRLRTTAVRPLLSELPKDTLRTLRELNELDIELYNYAGRIYRSELKKQDINVEDYYVYPSGEH